MRDMPMYMVYIEIHGLGLVPYYITEAFFSKEEAICSLEDEGYIQVLDDMYTKLDKNGVFWLANIKRVEWK
nr:hypothetical protein [Helcococcus sueciensis]